MINSKQNQSCKLTCLVGYCTVPCTSLLQTHADAYIGKFEHVMLWIEILKIVCVYYF